MKRTTKTLRRFTVFCWVLFAWIIAGEIDALPRLSDSVWLRWQVVMMLGLVLGVTTDRLAELRCRCCGARDVLLRALVTRSHEMLCERCLRWNPAPSNTPVVVPTTAVR